MAKLKSAFGGQLRKKHEKIQFLSENGNKCFSCNACFDNFIQLAKHVTKMHYKKKELQYCKKCHKKFGSKNGLIRHPCIAKNVEKETKNDSKDHNDNDNLNEEILKDKNVEKSDSQFYQCKNCFKKFGSDLGLMGHPCKPKKLETKSINDVKITEVQNNFESNQESLKEKNPMYQCKKCLEKFDLEFALTKHSCLDTVVEELIENNIENDDENDYDLKQLILTNENLQKAAQDIKLFTCFSCKLCENLFFTKYHLKKHVENVHYDNEANDHE